MKEDRKQEKFLKDDELKDIEELKDIDDIDDIDEFEELNKAAKIYLKVMNYIEKFDRFLTKLAYTVHRKCERLDVEDVKQQIILKLLVCAKKYDENKDKSNTRYFSQIAINCSNTIIRTYWQTKNKPNVECVSLDATIMHDEDAEFITLIKDDENSFLYPVNYYIKSLFEDNLHVVKEGLSAFEKKVLSFYLKGEDIETIAKKLRKSKKTIYNALKIIRDKIKDFM